MLLLGADLRSGVAVLWSLVLRWQKGCCPISNGRCPRPNDNGGLDQQQTATGISRAGNHWVSAAMRGQDAPLERLRVDRKLEEALVQGPDLLHVAEVFGLYETTAMRYADCARALLEQAAEQCHP